MTEHNLIILTLIVIMLACAANLEPEPQKCSTISTQVQSDDYRTPDGNSMNDRMH
jgi:hypothetical protein